MTQTPPPDGFLLKWQGEKLEIALSLETPRKGRAAFRTNIGGAAIRRREIIAETESGEVPMARAWNDYPLEEVAPGRFAAEIALEEVGVFSGKACFFPEGSNVPEWVEGANLHVKVESRECYKNNSIYTVFPRQFGSFREIVRRLPLIMGDMGFRIIQTLPPFPVPTTYAVMGEYGCPFAALDFLSVDPAMAEFDEYTTPLGQFRELINAVHAREGLFFIDLPANHTGWASTLQTHHPEWFHREKDGKFVSPGAWGVVWADLVELDYSNPKLRSYIADVFLFWCRNGVDGFRCDAGYMIPAETWEYIVAKVREEYPDTVFMLEGLGGDLAVTDRLLSEANIDWAYSEIFQTYNRDQFEWYLPSAIARSEKYGTLVHFAETHDNDRLAKGGKTYAKLRVQLAALLSWQGAWGIANGVEWYCTEKIDVHGKNGLNWGAGENMVELIGKLNRLLAADVNFQGKSSLKLVTRGAGNTLAVTRNGKVLILANLDCGQPAAIEWDLNEFPCRDLYDLLTGRELTFTGPVMLMPGEVKCLVSSLSRRAQNAAPKISVAKEETNAVFHWVYPRDVKRDVVIPQSRQFEVSAANRFRVRIIDPESGKTLRVMRSQLRSHAPHGRGIYFATIVAPEYSGDGTATRKLQIVMTVYERDTISHSQSTICIPPPFDKARVMIKKNAAAIKADTLARAILSNGAGAASQLRIGWSEINSQYDAILAANPDARCPSDRVNIWTRMRCWLQYQGYSRQFDARCITEFTADPAGRFARWDFVVPCGMGKNAAFRFEIALAKGENAARLQIRRVHAGKDDVLEPVRIVFRPDIEWRSFHSTTKAYSGAEKLFPSAVTSNAKGFSFHPFGKDFRMEVEGGEYHHNIEWCYNVPHGEEAARCQEPSGDLFSPGWISVDLPQDGAAKIVGWTDIAKSVAASELRFPESSGDEPATMPLAEALHKALDLFIVRRDELKTVIAGYPWFLDWGRDTFIFMRGMIAAGMIEDSLAILRAFARFEENGTLPNIIYGKTAGNRDTCDAQLFFIRAVKEIADIEGVERVADLLPCCNSIIENYVKGTPNGIRVDDESGLVWSPSHFTWMDTNYPACTPRMGYPVDIQALWISALEFLGRKEAADKAKHSLEKYYLWENGYRDCLAAPNGEAALYAAPEDTIRPNQLFLVSLDVVTDGSIPSATEELAVPGGMRSLNAAHPLYKGEYAGDEDTRRKPAYHNGTVWAWPWPMFAEALVKTGRCPAAVALDLLASAVENINNGAMCQMSEIADGDAPHAQKGCIAQAWSVSELLRVWIYLTKMTEKTND